METFATATAEFERLVAAVPPNAWDNPTPCDITVRELVDHVVSGNIFAVRLLGGASATDAVAGLDVDQLGDDALSAVISSGAEQLTAFGSADRTPLLHHPSGDISYETFVRFRLGDLVVHAWDLAIGAELDPTLDPAVVEGLWAIVVPHLDSMRAMSGYGGGPSGELPADATAQERLLDAFGRRA